MFGFQTFFISFIMSLTNRSERKSTLRDKHNKKTRKGNTVLPGDRENG